MGLSNDLISQFVKVTNDNKKTKSDTTAFGTVVEYDSSLYVKLDGSELLTPVSTTADIHAGERVMVTIKNHTATVTGNVSSPSTNLQTELDNGDGTTTKLSDVGVNIQNGVVRIKKLETDSLTADSAIIKDLQANDVTITGKLNANEADIKTLKANDVTITGKLDANEASIKDLKTDKLDVTEADIKYATIENLKATNAEIDNLDADVADINTLMFGSASGNVIHTSFANAVIAQLGNAQIKSAMIDSLSADKITAGYVITNKVRVISEDGKLVISDETIQISDDSRVRVQIGKDAHGDYSINIWDVNGNLMFSEGGITGSAIKEAIIRNDMVSDNANISASKLNIDSLFTEINGSSKTINSSKIYLNDEEQTLDVAFTSMSTGVDELQRDVSSQGTQLSVIQGKIDSKVWQQDIDTATGEMNTKYSELEQSLNGFKTTVSETYSTKEDLDNLTIGGRNLILNSANLIADGLDSTPGSRKEYRNINVGQSYMNIEDGTKLLLSFDLEMQVNTANPTLHVYTSTHNRNCPKGFVEIIKIPFVAEPNTVIKQRCTINVTMTSRENPTLTDNYLEFYTIYGTSNWFKISNIKLESGTKPTDWTPAPEDVETGIESLSTKHSEIKQTVDSISSEVISNTSKISDLSTELSSAKTTIKQNSDAIELRATKTEVTEELNTALGDYYTKEETNSAINVKSDEITIRVDKKVDNIEVGGRNYFSNRSKKPFDENNEFQLDDYKDVGSFTQFYNLTKPMSDFVGKPAIISFDVISPNGETPISVYNSNSKPRYLMSTKGVITPINNEWTHQEIAITVTDRGDSTDYSVDYSNKIEIYCPKQMGCKVRNVKLELGNKATDWTPAPEDVNETFDEVRQEIVDQSAEITTTAKGIILEELASYTKTGDFDEFKGSTETSLKLLSDSLSLKFTETNEGLEQSKEELQKQLNKITTYFTFDINGFTIGKTDNPYKIVITNDRYSMRVNDEEILYIASDTKEVCTPGLKVTDSLSILGLLIDKDGSGNINCEWISEGGQ